MKKNLMKTHGSTAAMLVVALATRAVGRWPLLVAAIGGFAAHRLWLNLRMRKLEPAMQRGGRRSRADAARDAASVYEGWSPTAPGQFD